jgi:putative membrane protein
MRKIFLSLAALTLVGACGNNDADQTAADTATMDTAGAVAAPSTQAPAATGALTDPQIAAIVVAANNADIEAAKLAGTKSTNPEVKKFSERMLTDHNGVNKAATDLVTKLGVTPEENPTSQQFTQTGQQTRQQLSGLSGAEFDKAYAASEVTYHQGLLDGIDNALIPNAQNAELKALLEQTRPAVAAHLQHAQELQASLGKS